MEKRETIVSHYFQRPRKPIGRPKKSRTIVRYIPIEGDSRKGEEKPMLAYVFYAGEHWFLLDQMVRIFSPVLRDNELDEERGYCCPWGCKLKLLTRDAYRRIGGPNDIMISSCSDSYVLEQVESLMKDQNIPYHHDPHECTEFPKTGTKWPILLSGLHVQNRIRQYDDDDKETGVVLRKVLLIDFQSLYELCRMTRPEFHSLLSLFLAFSTLCTGRGEARSALTKRDKEIVAAKQKWRCGVCDELFDSSARYEIDHGVALSLGGRNNQSNLWAVCITCHKNKTEEEMSYPLLSLYIAFLACLPAYSKYDDNNEEKLDCFFCSLE